MADFRSLSGFFGLVRHQLCIGRDVDGGDEGLGAVEFGEVFGQDVDVVRKRVSPGRP